MKQLFIVTLALLAAPAPTAPPRPTAPQSQASRDLQVFMKKELNPAFTDLSYRLFHSPGAATAPDEAVFESAERLRALADRLPSYAEDSPGDLTSFQVHAVQLRIATRALASSEGSDVKAWFNQVSAVCSSCHDDYKH